MDTSQMRRADEENVSEHSAQTNSAEDESSQDDNDNTSNDSTFREENEEGSTRGYNSYNSTHQVTFYDDSETSSIEAWVCIVYSRHWSTCIVKETWGNVYKAKTVSNR